MKSDFLKLLREGDTISFPQQIRMILKLSTPAIMAQISSIIMQYIDAAMVGHLGANDSASIGLISSSTWLLGGLCSAAGIGFTVMIAHRIGAEKKKEARNIVKLGLISSFLFSIVLMIAGVAVSGALPRWLGGTPELFKGASGYFRIYSIFIPILGLNYIAGGMLQCSGNMKLPSILNIFMCFLDVIYNYFLIFPTRNIVILGRSVRVFGAGMGITGAALGTGLAELTIVIFMIRHLLFKSELLHVRKDEKFYYSPMEMISAVKIAVPIGIEQIIMCGAYIASTKIVSPLGTVAIAAHSFSITAESLCYMPGYGVGTAATTIVGQSIGAGRRELTRRLGWLATGIGIILMAASGYLMYRYAPFMIGFLTNDPDIRSLGATVLRIEAYAEPMYAASIVASGVFRGAGDTFIPSCLNFCSMWLIRIPLSAHLAPRYGLIGVWLAMCLELCIRGILFLGRMLIKKYA